MFPNTRVNQPTERHHRFLCWWCAERELFLQVDHSVRRRKINCSLAYFVHASQRTNRIAHPSDVIDFAQIAHIRWWRKKELILQLVVSCVSAKLTAVGHIYLIFTANKNRNNQWSDNISFCAIGWSSELILQVVLVCVRAKSIAVGYISLMLHTCEWRKTNVQYG